MVGSSVDSGLVARHVVVVVVVGGVGEVRVCRLATTRSFREPEEGPCDRYSTVWTLNGAFFSDRKGLQRLPTTPGRHVAIQGHSRANTVDVEEL